MYLALCCYCPAFFFCDFWSRFSIALVIALKEAPRTAFADFPRTMFAKLFLKLQLDFLESADRSPLISACNLFALTLERAFGRKTGDFLLSILQFRTKDSYKIKQKQNRTATRPRAHVVAASS